MEQIHLFDLTKEKYKITKPIRLIELFGGIGSQAMALERLVAIIGQMIEGKEDMYKERIWGR